MKRAPAALVMILALIIPASGAAAPGNNNFPGTAITSLPYSVSFTLSGASHQAGEPMPSCAGSDGSIWYSYTAASSGPLVASVQYYYDSIVAVYTGDSLRTLDEIGCQYTTSIGQPATVVVDAAAGTTYYFQVTLVDYPYSDSGTFKLQSGVVPPNDTFAAATVIGTFPAVANAGTDALASLEPQEPSPACGGNTFGRSTWFSWTSPSSAPVLADLAGSHAVNVLAVYSGPSITSLTEHACSRYSGMARWNAVAGTTYHIQTGTMFGTAGDITLNLNPLVPGDDFASAISVAPDSTTSVELRRSTLEPGEPPSCGYAGTVWLKLENHTGVVKAEVPNQSPYPVISIFDGDWSQQVSCTYSWDMPEYFEAKPGHTYYIRMAYYIIQGAASSTTLTLTSIPALPNDEASSAEELIGAPATATGETYGSTTSVADPTPSCGRAVEGTSWYTWTAPQTRDYVVDAVGSDFDTVVAAYRGSSPTALTEVACNDDHNATASRFVLPGEAGTKYWFLAGGYRGNRGALTLNIDTELINDDFAAARDATGTLYADVTHNLRATTEPNEPKPSCNPSNQTVSTLWYRYRPATPGLVTVDTLAATFNTVVAVYTGTEIQSLAQVACNDDAASGSTTSLLTFSAALGETYWIQVGGWRARYPSSTDPDVAHGQLSLRILSSGI